MDELDTKKMLKIFGVTVTDFETESQRIIQEARELAGSPGQKSATKFAEITRDVLELIADMDAKWMDVTNYLQSQRRKMYEELAQTARKLLSSGGS